MPENKFVLISLLKYSYMHSSTIFSAGVAAALKTTSLGPIVDFIQSINDQSTKIALTQIAKDHEERLKMLESTSGINLQILEKIKALFQGKGGVEELKEVVDFQRNGEHACLLLPGLLLDDDIRSKFLVNLSHAGDGAKIIEVSNKPALEIGRPDLLHFLIKDTREKILLCQTPVGLVNLALEWQKERTRKQRGNHELGIEPFEKFDFVYDKDGVPKAKLNTQTNSYNVPKVKAKPPERSEEDIQNRIKNIRRTVISLVLLALSGLSVYGIKKCQQDENETQAVADNIRDRMTGINLDAITNVEVNLQGALDNLMMLRTINEKLSEVKAQLNATHKTLSTTPADNKPAIELGIAHLSELQKKLEAVNGEKQYGPENYSDLNSKMNNAFDALQQLKENIQISENLWSLLDKRSGDPVQKVRELLLSRLAQGSTISTNQAQAAIDNMSPFNQFLAEVEAASKASPNMSLLEVQLLKCQLALNKAEQTLTAWNESPKATYPRRKDPRELLSWQLKIAADAAKKIRTIILMASGLPLSQDGNK